MAKPILLTVDDDPDVLRAIERDLRSHYGAEYRVLSSDSPEGALDLLTWVASESHMLVHGLAVDDAALARARKEIELKRLLGQAAVEKTLGKLITDECFRRRFFKDPPAASVAA